MNFRLKVYARAFTAADDKAPADWKWRWPTEYKRAILLANLDPGSAHTVEIAGASGSGEVWSVSWAVSGYGHVPYAKQPLNTSAVELPALGTAVVLVQTR